MIPLINLIRRWKSAAIRPTVVLMLAAGLLVGCIQPAAPTSPPPDSPPALTPAPAYPWRDEAAVMSGICFEAAFDAAGTVYVLRNAEEHIRFYELADNSQLCRHPVTRYPFDFSAGDVLAGLWSKGRGCTARYTVLAYTRDDAARSFTITLRFAAEGDCPYDLVSPFWVGLPGLAGYAVHINLETGG